MSTSNLGLGNVYMDEPGGEARSSEQEYERILREGSIDDLIAAAERDPDLARAINQQDVYDRFIAPRERADFARALSRLSASQRAQTRSSTARNTDLARRMGFGGGLGSGLQTALTSSTAAEFAEQRRNLAAEHQRRLNSPARFAPLHQIAEASARGQMERGREQADAAKGVGAAGQILGGILDFINPIAGGFTRGATQLYALPQQAAADVNIQAGADIGRNLGTAARGVQGVKYQDMLTGSAGGGLDLRASGAGQPRTRFGVEEDEEDDYGWGT